jgi:hypothetical protein
MMLLVALAKMLDKTECLFFINTGDSTIKVSETINKTKSPWIYSEIAISQMIRVQKLNRNRTVKLFESGGEIQKSFSVTVPVNHPLDLSHLSDLSIDDISNWYTLYNKNKQLSTYKKYPLDLLYYMNLKK